MSVFNNFIIKFKYKCEKFPSFIKGVVILVPKRIMWIKKDPTQGGTNERGSRLSDLLILCLFAHSRLVSWRHVLKRILYLLLFSLE